MNPARQYHDLLSRRAFLGNSATTLGGTALAGLMAEGQLGAKGIPLLKGDGLGLPHHKPTAKRVIYMFMCGGPSHIDLFDFKPAIRKLHGQELPASVRMGQRLTGMTSGQKKFPCVAPMFDFKRHGQHGTWISELLPNIAAIADDITVVRSMNTEAVNHDPAITYINTGDQQPGRPSMGAWLNYGLGSSNKDLPSYVVMISRGKGATQALYARLWGSGFLPTRHQGVKFRSSGEPVLYLRDPKGLDRESRRRMLDGIARLNQATYERDGDPETLTRIAQYEMAYRMQTSVPDLMELKNEPDSTFELYGEDARKPGTFARNCVLARRMAERGVQFIQLFHRGWDQHGNLPRDIRSQAKDIDRAAAGLVADLKQRGMLDDTLVIWGGEFGRTIYSQGGLSATNHGRDHHGRCFSTWLAGGGIKPGFDYGETDDHCYNIVKDPVHIRDLNATVLHALGIDHERFTFQFQGLEQKLTGVEEARVVSEILA